MSDDCDSGIAELLTIADVDASRLEEARGRLQMLLMPMKIGAVTKSRMRSLYDAANQREVPKAHNKPLAALETAAHKLENALAELRKHPSAYFDFWMDDEFAPRFSGEIENGAVVDAAFAVQVAARRARITGNGRPLDVGKRRVVERARRFFDEYSKTPSTVDGPFRSFVLRFFEVVTEQDVMKEEGEPLTRAMRDVFKRRQRNPPKKH